MTVLASVYAHLDDHDRAISSLREALKQKPSYQSAAIDLAKILRARGRSLEALSIMEDRCQRFPSHQANWLSFADVLAEVGKYDEARKASRTAAKLDPYRDQLASAISALERNDRVESEKRFRSILKKQPRHLHALVGLASIAMDRNAVADAETLLREARIQAPFSDIVWRNWARLQMELGDEEEAEDSARRALAIAPKSPDSWSMLGSILARGLEPAEAASCFRKSLQLKPNQPAVWLSLGHVCKTLGNRTAAESAYKEAISLSPNFGEAYWSLADLKNYRFSREEMQNIRAAIARIPVSASEQRASLYFALGKACHDSGSTTDAFEAYASGNRLKAEISPFDIENFVRECDRVSAAFAQFKKNGFQDQKGRQCEEACPIFILGMPRSGSTLTEQILASHSLVEGTMELPHISRYARQLMESGGYYDLLSNGSEERFHKIGERYLEETKRFRSDAPYFIDKMPNNFMHVGLIKRALPQALVIDTRRDPRDCLLSLFFQNFARGQSFSYSFESLTSYYEKYVSMMQLWDQVFPSAVYRMIYESLVSDFDLQVAALLEFCGLPYEEGCSRFYETKRPVRTASAEQVRQPLNTLGLGRWHQYELQLRPMLQVLDAAGL